MKNWLICITLLLIFGSIALVFSLVKSSEATPILENNQKLVVSENSSIEVVKKYVEFSKERKFKELKNLIVTNPSKKKLDSNRSSNSIIKNSSSLQKDVAPIKDDFKYSDLTEAMPKWIDENNLYVQKIDVVDSNDEESQIRVKFGFEKEKTYYATIDFYLLKTLDNDWKIYDFELP